MIECLVLGAGAGGGFPQWNSAAPGCVAARCRSGTLPRTQTSLAVSADGKHWFLLNASPDLRQQINDTPALHPSPESPGTQGLGTQRHTPIQGVLLTSGEIDALAGLLNLREREAFTLMGSPSTLNQLKANPIFNALDPAFVKRTPLLLDTPCSLLNKDGCASGLVLTAFAVPGKAPLYAEEAGSNIDDTLGFNISDGTHNLLFIPGCAHITPDIIRRASQSDLLLFDGTLYHDDEMIRAGLGCKTGKRMGHVSVAEPDGPLTQFAHCSKPRKILIHINNSNPILMDDSAERAAITNAGWTVAADGMTLTLDMR